MHSRPVSGFFPLLRVLCSFYLLFSKSLGWIIQYVLSFTTVNVRITAFGHMPSLPRAQNSSSSSNFFPMVGFIMSVLTSLIAIVIEL